MKNQVISYRGAKTTLAELKKLDEQNHHLHPEDEMVSYRGATGPANFGKHTKRTRTVSYRGAKMEMAV